MDKGKDDGGAEGDQDDREDHVKGCDSVQSGFSLHNNILPFLENAVVGQLSGQPVSGQNQCQVNKAGEEADGLTEGIVAVHNTDTVNVGGKDLRGLVGSRLLHQQNLFHRGAEDLAALQDQHGGNGGGDGGKGDAQHLTPAAGAVQTGCLVQAGVNIGDSCQVDDGAPADALPHTGDQVQRTEPVLLHDEEDGLAAEGFDDQVDGALGGVTQGGDQRDDNHGGHEVRHVGDGLDRLLEPGVAHFVQQQSEDDNGGEADGQGLNTQHQGVADVGPEVGGLEEDFKVPEADEGGALQTQPGVILEECQRNTPHGKIVEHQVVDKCG